MNGWRLRERAVALVGLLAALLTMASTAQGQSVFINEIHYDNIGNGFGRGGGDRRPRRHGPQRLEDRPVQRVDPRGRRRLHLAAATETLPPGR